MSFFNYSAKVQQGIILNYEELTSQKKKKKNQINKGSDNWNFTDDSKTAIQENF